ncbi:FAD-dependent oxidoreductase [Ornithinibacillus sp. L9]|uniref:FAD-dependent oxidoreductase n=1 Tax=Ornithinibacillus caprae TaxID=2678566 RepID=A0A6N8FHD8_9BACI|nr:NAD(P)/FAD-dependent oxidoreductase [Ornithinibacillus caprae]MUK87674.1 FAD-dependent oxidoreductase [Ornithinibacillus caprae]
MKKVKVLIIGGGPAGIAAAIWCQRLHVNHLLIESKSQLGGQLHQIKNEIIDYPGSHSKNGLELLNKLTSHVQSVSCNYKVKSTCINLNLKEKTVTITAENTEQYVQFEYLIIATGAAPKKLGIPGEQAMIDRGEIFSTSQDGHLYKDKVVAIVGGGDRALEGTNTLATNGAIVHLIHRSTHFRAREDLVNSIYSHPNVIVHTNANVERIFDNGQKVTAISINKNNTLHTESVDGLLIRIGTKANSEFIKDHVQADKNGIIGVDRFGQTTKDNVFAIGDVATFPPYTSISTAVGQAMQAVKRITLLDKFQRS